jgi:hypothetical protein
MDPTVPRQTLQDLATSLGGGEKMITYANILDLLGFCKEFEEDQVPHSIDNLDNLEQQLDLLPDNSNFSPPISPRSSLLKADNKRHSYDHNDPSRPKTPQKRLMTPVKPQPTSTVTVEEREMIHKLLCSPSGSRVPQSPLQRSLLLRQSQQSEESCYSTSNSTTTRLNNNNSKSSNSSTLKEFSQSTTFSSTFPSSSSSSSSKLSTTRDKPKYGALGYTANQLAEFGYAKHAGRWRGFPYDSYSCCNTSQFVCPKAPKEKKKKVVIPPRTLSANTGTNSQRATSLHSLQSQSKISKSVLQKRNHL